MDVATEPSRRFTRRWALLVGASIATVGVLIGMSGLLVARRVDGDLSRLITFTIRGNGLVPAWVVVGALALLGVLIVALGVWALWALWRARTVEAVDDAVTDFG